MTPPSFHRLVDDYLRVRRGLGFDLESTEWKLRDFATYADRIGHSGAVTIELAVEWAQSNACTLEGLPETAPPGPGGRAAARRPPK